MKTELEKLYTKEYLGDHPKSKPVYVLQVTPDEFRKWIKSQLKEQRKSCAEKYRSLSNKDYKQVIFAEIYNAPESI